MAVELEKFGLEIFIQRAIQGKKGAAVSGTQGHPTNQPTKLYLVKMCEDVGRRLKSQVFAKELKTLQECPTVGMQLTRSYH